MKPLPYLCQSTGKALYRFAVFTAKDQPRALLFAAARDKKHALTIARNEGHALTRTAYAVWSPMRVNKEGEPW